MSGRRYLALALPRLPTDRLERLDPALRAGPVAVWAESGNRRLLVAVNQAAAAQHLAPGMKLADATAMLPGLATLPHAPAADAALLENLARFATRYTPLGATDGSQALVLDIFGCTHAWPDEAALLQDAAARFSRMGFAVSAAVAGTAAAALALARAGRHGSVVAPGQEAAALANLPLAALGLDPALLERLEGFGLRHVAALARLPRAALSRRLGPAALLPLDRALGAAPAPIRPLAPLAEFAAAIDFAEPILTAEAIAAALDRLLAELSAQLGRAGRGARRLTLASYRVDGQVQRIGIGTSMASREAGHLRRLFRDRLERIAPGFGIDRLALSADATETSAPRQHGFAQGVAARAERREELAELLDRLRGRLAPGAVHRLALYASHLPERAVAATPPEAPQQAEAEEEKPRPVRLLSPPEAVDVLSLLPDGPPKRFRWKNRVLGVARAEGPERIAPEWWHAPDAATRDYWRVEAEEGGRFWLYRDNPPSSPPPRPARWFLHGLFG